MEKSRLQKTLKFGLSMLMLSVFAVSVTWAASDINPLKKDKMSKTSYTSVFFGRVRYINEVKGFNAYGKSLRFEVNNNLKSKKFGFSFPIKPRSESWKTADSQGYDTRFAAEFTEGNYSLNKVEFQFDDFAIKNLATSVGDVDNCYINYLSFPIEKPCIMGGESLIYLGVIEVRLTEIKIMPGGQYTWSYKVQMRDDEFEKDRAEFQKTYPKVYESLKDKIVKNPWKITANNLIME